MKDSTKLHAGFSFMFIDVLMALLIFFICLVPTFTQEAFLHSNLPKNPGCARVQQKSPQEIILIRSSTDTLFVADREFSGKMRYRHLRKFLVKLIEAYRNANAEGVKIVLEQAGDVPFGTMMSLLDACYDLANTKDGFAKIAYSVINFSEGQTDKE